MLLLCFGIYLVLGLLFTTLYWMSVAVGKKHDEEKGYR
jgi:glycopeptide antibiotics resistance protein